MPSLHDPEPPAHELWCARCGHRWMEHPAGGGACLWWDPATGDHCHCPGFLYVSPPGSGPPEHPRYRGAPEVLRRLR